MKVFFLVFAISAIKLIDQIGDILRKSVSPTQTEEPIFLAQFNPTNDARTNLKDVLPATMQGIAAAFESQFMNFQPSPLKGFTLNHEGIEYDVQATARFVQKHIKGAFVPGDLTNRNYQIWPSESVPMVVSRIDNGKIILSGRNIGCKLFKRETRFSQMGVF